MYFQTTWKFNFFKDMSNITERKVEIQSIKSRDVKETKEPHLCSTVLNGRLTVLTPFWVAKEGLS